MLRTEDLFSCPSSRCCSEWQLVSPNLQGEETAASLRTVPPFTRLILEEGPESSSWERAPTTHTLSSAWWPRGELLCGWHGRNTSHRASESALHSELLSRMSGLHLWCGPSETPPKCFYSFFGSGSQWSNFQFQSWMRHLDVNFKATYSRTDLGPKNIMVM